MPCCLVSFFMEVMGSLASAGSNQIAVPIAKDVPWPCTCRGIISVTCLLFWRRPRLLLLISPGVLWGLPSDRYASFCWTTWSENEGECGSFFLVSDPTHLPQHSRIVGGGLACCRRLVGVACLLAKCYPQQLEEVAHPYLTHTVTDCGPIGHRLTQPVIVYPVSKLCPVSTRLQHTACRVSDCIQYSQTQSLLNI